jgi:hypothetical protein
MAHQAQDTFVADLDDGTILRVARGEVFPDNHPLVKRDQAGAGVLFKPLDLGEAADQTPKPRARAAKGGS